MELNFEVNTTVLRVPLGNFSDDINELMETFTVVLSLVSDDESVTLGPAFTATVDIFDNNGKPICNTSQVCHFLWKIII